MAFRRSLVQPQFADLKGILAQSKETDNALYQTVEALIERLTQLQAVTVEEATRVAAVTGPGDVMGPASSINDSIVLFSGITGKIIKNSNILIGRVPLLDLANIFTMNQLISKSDSEYQLLDSGTMKGRFAKFSTGTYISDNVSLIGGTVNLDDTTQPGLLMLFNGGACYIYSVTAGANPRSLSNDFQVDATQVTVHKNFYANLNSYLFGLVDLIGGQLKFPAVQNPSTDPNTYDDYEEGTWTPIDSSGAGLTFSAVEGTYVKNSQFVFCACVYTYPATANGLAAVTGGLPFVSRNTGNMVGAGLDSYTPTSGGARIFRYVRNNWGAFQNYQPSGAAYTNAQFSTQTHYVVLMYRSAD